VLACVDVHYGSAAEATAACIVFQEWNAKAAAEQHVVHIDQVAGYVSGQFFRRELPCLLSVLGSVSTPLETIVVDGYVWLDLERPGLGWHLYDALGRAPAVVGVAKTNYEGNRAAVALVRHGRKPLYVTAVGMSATAASARIAEMRGQYRIPTLLRAADRLSRGHP
jgi:deoxyribonuclease V